MRLKNIKGAKEKIESSNYVILNPTNYINKYQEIFNNNNPIKIEIGMGKGSFIIENAKRYPNVNFIGIEKFDSVMVRAVEKVEEQKLENLRLIRMDALEIDQVFHSEIDTIYLNFSDPWPKNRHENRRLTNSIFLGKYDMIFKENCNIIFKTDNRKLFEYSVKSLTDYGYLINNISLDLHNDDISDNIETEYESKFSKLGQVIYMIDVTKKIDK